MMTAADAVKIVPVKVVRWGEASNPGPRCEWHVVTINTNTVYKKEQFLTAQTNA